MAADWEKLADDYKSHEVGLIAQVDCTKQTALCAEFEVEGYPTLYFGDPASPEAYSGGREYEELAAFAKDNIGTKLCSIYSTEACEEEEKKVIMELQGKSLDELTAMVMDVEKDAEEAEQLFEKEVAALQEQYKAVVNDYNEKVDALKDKSNYKYMRAILAKMEHELGIGKGTDQDGEL